MFGSFKHIYGGGVQRRGARTRKTESAARQLRNTIQRHLAQKGTHVGLGLALSRDKTKHGMKQSPWFTLPKKNTFLKRSRTRANPRFFFVKQHFADGRQKKTKHDQEKDQLRKLSSRCVARFSLEPPQHRSNDAARDQRGTNNVTSLLLDWNASHAKLEFNLALRHVSCTHEVPRT